MGNEMRELFMEFSREIIRQFETNLSRVESELSRVESELRGEIGRLEILVKKVDSRVDQLDMNSSAQGRFLRSQLLDLQDQVHTRSTARLAEAPHALPLASIVSTGIAGLDLVHRD